MSTRFPNLESHQSDFPDANNVNVYKYDNKLDYSRFDATQMHVTLCLVPWDMGEVHIGNSTIRGVGNVVDFGSAKARDKWIADIPDSQCYRFDTDIRRLHRDEYMDVDLPFDIAAHYNYIAVYYELVPDADYPLMYERAGGVRSWFWFIRDVEQLAPNTTRLHILLDAWQTFIYDFNVTSMILERGHAPMLAMPTDKYLEDPFSNSVALLTDDENFGDIPTITTNTDSFVFNAGDMYAVIIMTANGINGIWGSKANDNWKTPATRHFRQQGVPNYCAFAVATADLDTFLSAIDSTYPQAMQCISAIAFVSADVLNLGTTHENFGVTCYEVSAGYKRQTVTTITKAQFAYPERYQDLAKLYTYPYAVLEVTDQDGNTSEIRIEDTDGKIELDYCLSLAYPWLNISGQICNTGRAGRKNVSFKNVTERNMPIGGNWHKLLMQWDIPTFGIVQDAGTHNDFATHYDRAQQTRAGLNSYNSEIASAAASLADVNASAAAAQGNANANAANIVANAGLQNALNNANNAANQTKIRSSETNSNMQAAGNTAVASALTTNSTNNEIDKMYATGTTAAVSSAVTGAISGGMALAATGPGAAVGAVAGAAVGAISAGLNMQAGINYTSAQLDAASNQMSRSLAVAQAATTGEADAMSAQESSRTAAANSFTTGTNANSAATINANAARDYAAATGNATRDYNAASDNAARNLDTANSAVSNQVKQAALDAPMEYGTFANGDTSTTRPMGIFANIVTQNTAAISRAGDEFLRYGYRYDKQWTFGGRWALAPKFTYWKLRDFWVSNINIPDMYADKLRFFLYGGVTVWRKPEYIGNTSIYENV